MAPQVWFITGASSGFGLEAVKQVVENGDIAVATLRNPSNAPELAELASKHADRILVLPLDVTKPETVRPIFEKAIEKFGRIDVVYNNAGSSLAGEAEGTSLDAAKGLFDVNFWGVVAVSQEAVRIFRDVNPKTGKIGGILFQSSSVNGGSVSFPGTAFYGATKAAVTSFSEALQGELDPEWHIAVSSVQYSYFHTKVLQKGATAPPHPAYGQHLASHFARRVVSGEVALPGPEASDAVKALYTLSKKKIEEVPVLISLGMDSVQGARGGIVAREKGAAVGEELSKGFKIVTK